MAALEYVLLALLTVLHVLAAMESSLALFVLHLLSCSTDYVYLDVLKDITSLLTLKVATLALNVLVNANNAKIQQPTALSAKTVTIPIFLHVFLLPVQVLLTKLLMVLVKLVLLTVLLVTVVVDFNVLLVLVVINC